MFEMFDKTYIIYLGVGIVIVAVAFFAYQELQKHKTEIQKLRYESEKLQKIIHAYNMKQWHQDPSEEPNDTDDDSDDSDSEVQTHQSLRQPSQNMQSIISETLHNLTSSARSEPTSLPQTKANPERDGNIQQPAQQPSQQPAQQPAQQSTRHTVLDAPTAVFTPLQVPPTVHTPSVMTTAPVSAPAPVPVPAPPTPQIDDDDEELPMVDTFAVETTKINAFGDEQLDERDNQEKPNKRDDRDDRDNRDNRDEQDEQDEQDNNDKDDVNVPIKSNEDSDKCSVVIKFGPNKGQVCGGKIKVAGLCVRHYKSSTPQQ